MTTNLSKCSYCGQEIELTDEAMAAHIIECLYRPELGLVLRMEYLETLSQKFLGVIHSLVSAVAEIQGMRTTSWDIYHDAEKALSVALNTTPEQFAEQTRKVSMEESDGNINNGMGNADDRSDAANGDSQNSEVAGEAGERT